MKELNWINDSEYTLAISQSLPQRSARVNAFQNFQYFIEAANQARTDSNPEQNLKLSLQSPLQDHMQKVVKAELPEIEKKARELTKNKNLNIETALIVIDMHFGQVIGALGGQQFQKSQFNRLIHAKRPIGSIIKPFVYHYLFEENPDLNADTNMKDEPFTYKFSNQKWSPENYSKKHLGPIPLHFAFKESLNTPLVLLVTENNISNLYTTLQNRGFPKFENPSIILGSIELSPWNVANLYFKLLRTHDTNAEPKFELTPATPFNASAMDSATALVISLMQETAINGTAKAANSIPWNSVVGGKTGTTSDYKDSWFIGFNERYLTVVWVGSDQNLKTGLTGGSGALKLWIEVQKYLDQKTKPLVTDSTKLLEEFESLDPVTKKM